MQRYEGKRLVSCKYKSIRLMKNFHGSVYRDVTLEDYFEEQVKNIENKFGHIEF